MEVVTFSCRACDASIGDFTNLWTQIGKSYFSPIVDPQHDPSIKSHGPVRSGEKHTLVEGCQLQDIVCTHCGAVLGIRCISSPVNHVLDENQVLFRINTVIPLNHTDGEEVDLSVKRFLKLRDPPQTSTDNPAHGTTKGLHTESPAGSKAASAADLSLLHAELEVQRSNIERIDSAGFKVISGLDDAVNRVETDLGNVRNTLSDLRRELQGNHDDMASLKTEIKDVRKQSLDQTAIKRLEEQLGSMSHTVGSLRHGLDDVELKFDNKLDALRAGMRQNAKDIDDIKSLVRDRVTARDHAKDMAAIRADVAQLRKQVEGNTSKAASGAFPSRELDILTSNIAKIGNRASLVESLQMEFEIFKGRLERMEAANQPSQSQQVQASSAADKLTAYDRYDDHDYHQDGLRSSRRKRPSSGIDTSPLPASSSKRAATSEDVSDTINATQWSEDAPSSPLDTRLRPDATRASKTNRPGKSTQRPGRRSLSGLGNDAKPQSKRRG